MYTIKLEQFTGPFDLLLRLIEKEKLDICDISLARVTNKFLSYIDKLEQVSTQELADFLEIAAKLILFKSRLLVSEGLSDEELVDELVDQLRIYREYAAASKKIAYLVAHTDHAFAKDKIPINVSCKIPENLNINSQMLEKNFKSIVYGILDQIKLSQKTIKRKIISLKDKINELLDLVKKHNKIIFNNFIQKKQRTEQTVMFLAVLELIKQKQIIVKQKELFGEIIISKL